MPDQLTLEEFGQNIKAKYPEYARFSDTDIANRVLAKYPQYKSSIIASVNPTAQGSTAAARPGWQERIDQKLAAPPVDTGWRGAIERTGKRAAATFISPVLHPVETFKSTGAMAVETSPALSAIDELGGHPQTGPIKQRAQEFAEEWKRDKGEAVENAAGDAIGMLLSAKVAEVGGKAFKGAMTKSLEATREGAQSMVGAGEKAVRAQVAKAAEGAQTDYEKAQAASQKNTESTLESQAKTRAARLRALKEQREAQRAHAAEVEQTKTENTEAVKKQAKIEPTQQKLTEASEQLRARVETAREKALKVGNKKYSGVNEKLNHIPADNEAVSDALTDSAEKIKGSQIRGAEAKPRILDDIEARIQKGDSFTYEDLQGYYSELNRELSKGNLPGDVYTAYDTLHEAIGDEMQRIADSQGQGAQLTDARNYWRRMKQTFGKPYNPNDAATATMEKSSPEFMRAEEQANRLRLLGSFDPEIPKVDANIQNLRKGAAKLGEPKPIRDVVKPLSDAPETKALPEYGEPRGSVPFEKPRVSTRAIREQKLDQWTSGESQLSKFQVRSLVGGGLGAVIGAVFDHGTGATVGGIAGSVFGPTVIGRLVELPSVREWLTRPPAGELETLQKLPSADRIKLTDGLAKMIPQAQAAGIKVDPRILALTGSTVTLPRTRQLQDLRAAQQHHPQQ